MSKLSQNLKNLNYFKELFKKICRNVQEHDGWCKSHGVYSLYLPNYLPSLLIQEVTDLEWWLGGSGPTNKPVMTMGAVAHAVYYWLVEQ
jgi:hypothetical protein